jgi:hypothetical protein
MGTSVNQSSPHTLNWKAAQAGYRDPSIPINRVTTEIWRAASNQPAGNLEQLLAHPIIAQIGALVERSSSSLDLSRKSHEASTHHLRRRLQGVLAYKWRARKIGEGTSLYGFSPKRQRIWFRATFPDTSDWGESIT